MLLDGEEEILTTLKKQYELLKVVSRDFSDVGFYTSFFIQNRDDLCLNGKSFYIGDIDGTVNGIEGAIGFILYIKDGYISLFEGYTNIIDKWLANEEITLTYDSGETRNIRSLKRRIRN